ncbi:hypothetical protein [Gordonia rhizosphera]|uniref:Uncharacterized protein n=1 Tax=Gordonia rhizosphera NBRC 16068 TaxID=1108045 RepID=K6WAM3_9ACTN|nr:hypothetical protein [Gordonia rhizosphera]GAB89252.1 hypothetical protein GORHZ_055_00350 [Gordonia rhizosphera NBRC 16068]
MKRRFSLAVASAAVVASVGAVAAPAASAAPLGRHEVFNVGSLSFCFHFPIGPVTITIC